MDSFSLSLENRKRWEVNLLEIMTSVSLSFSVLSNAFGRKMTEKLTENLLKQFGFDKLRELVYNRSVAMSD